MKDVAQRNSAANECIHIYNHENNTMERNRTGSTLTDRKPGLLVGIFCCSLYVTPVNADTSLHQGFNPLGTTNINITGIDGTITSKPDWDGLAFAIGKSSLSSACFSPNQALTHSTLGGYSGILISTGVLFVIYDGTLSGLRGTGAGTLNYSYSWNSAGVLSPPTNTQAVWCADPRVNVINGKGVRLALPNGYTTGSFHTGIYIAPGITNPTITVPSLYVTRGYASNIGSQPGTAIASTGKTYTVVSECTITTPSYIAFGNIDIGATSAVTSPDGGINVACTGAMTTVSISYSARAVSATHSATTLAMLNSQGEIQGNVRGFVGINADNDTGCNDTDTSMHFGSEPKSLLSNVANNQTHSIPLKWVLCPTQSAAPGQGTASATLDFIWQ